MSLVRGGPVKFLLVDDLEENLLALESLLRRPGLELLRARSGTQALELLLVHEVALALIDVQMPEMDGFELAETMRGSPRTQHVPIIFVTAGIREQNRIFKGYDAGAVDFLFKPIDPHILRNKTETFFQLHRQKQELSSQVAERERLTRELEETLRFNETFVAVVGHDLRNPLNAMLMGAQVLEHQNLKPESSQVVRQILSSGRRMRGILDDLADLANARLGSGIAVIREPADAGALVRKVVAEYRASHPTRVLEHTQQGELLGRWDGGRFEQIVANLIGNALTHGRESSTVTVKVDGQSTDAVVVSVHNLGHIAEELLPEIFLPFRAGTERTTRGQGLGLGLFIVQQLAAAHDGSVSVTSAEDTGTTFTVRLPRGAPIRA
jgi:two-component system sensor histidine kinase/response regulator